MRGDMLWIILCIGAAMCYVVVYDAGASYWIRPLARMTSEGCTMLATRAGESNGTVQSVLWTAAA